MENDKKEIDKKAFDIGFIGKDIMFVQFPIGLYVEEGQEGLDMFYGKVERIKILGATLIKQEYLKKNGARIIKPGNVIQ